MVVVKQLCHEEVHRVFTDCLKVLMEARYPACRRNVQGRVRIIICQMNPAKIRRESLKERKKQAVWPGA